MARLVSILSRLLLIALIMVVGVQNALCAKSDSSRILIISSYNPETNTASKTIEDFVSEYKSLSDSELPIIENLNCKTFSEMHTWMANLKGILDRYRAPESRPSLVLLLGQEAWATYLSLPKEALLDVPVMGSQVNRHMIKLSDTIPDPLIWEPKCVDVLSIAKDYNIVGGILHEYDMKSNVEMLLQFYPNTENIAVVSDNSYGGIVITSRTREIANMYPHINFIHIDGRKETVYSGAEHIAKLPPRTVILLGTWRVDKTGSYFIKKSLSMLRSDSEFPTFTITGLGIEDWAIGGYIPQYISQGKMLAQKAYSYLNSLADDASVSLPLKHLSILDNRYTFNLEQLDEYNIDLAKFKYEYSLINTEESIWSKYKTEIIIFSIIFVIFVVFAITISVLYIRTRNYKMRLENYQKELRVARDKAEESSKMKSSFLANMSHEIRTPLNAICGFAEVLTSDDVVNLEPVDRKYISQIIQNNANILLSLINGILDMSRIESGKMKYYNEEFDWVEICNESILTVKTATHSEIEYIFTSKHKELKMVADRQLMMQILINLLNNASKFTKEGSIVLELSGNDKYVTVSVTDTGIGIPLDKQKSIFDQFTKLNERSQGTGLGLALCKKIIEHYDGVIWVDNEYSKGARVVFSIPTDGVVDE